MTEERILKLTNLAKEKNRLLGDIIHITKRQMEEIQGDRYGDLDKSLSEKDSIIKEIDEIDRSFLEIFYGLKKENSIEDINELNVEQYPGLKDLKEEVKKVMSNLLALSLLDGKNNKSVKAKLEETKEDLKRVRLGKKAFKGYNHKQYQSMLIDEKK